MKMAPASLRVSDASLEPPASNVRNREIKPP
jgi:hypothetical protein